MNIPLFKIGFLPVTFIDILDITVISFLIYHLYKLLRGTRGAQMMVGLVIILLFSSIAPVFQLKGITWIFEKLSTIWLVAFVILFQPEIRRLLIFIGQSRIVRFFVQVTGSKVIDEVIKATVELRDKGYGALIVLVRETGLRAIIENGVKIQAEVTAPLILSIFNPRSPLHDGAVIIQNDIIEAARCILPISQELQDDPNFGTRHKAAMTLSEESDSMVIVVSEERGIISVAINGKLQTSLGAEELKRLLEAGYRYGNTTIK
ncbi:diadenylate cyclase CdaA [candidate division KSB1 bacterium]|nr:diadenylate cyclase CdaA [candidate division KSB1 bacterium]